MLFSRLDWGYVFWGGRPQRESAIFIPSFRGCILSTRLVTVAVKEHFFLMEDVEMEQVSTAELTFYPPHVVYFGGK